MHIILRRFPHTTHQQETDGRTGPPLRHAAVLLAVRARGGRARARPRRHQGARRAPDAAAHDATSRVKVIKKRDTSKSIFLRYKLSTSGLNKNWAPRINFAAVDATDCGEAHNDALLGIFRTEDGLLQAAKDAAKDVTQDAVAKVAQEEGVSIRTHTPNENPPTITISALAASTGGSSQSPLSQMKRMLGWGRKPPQAPTPTATSSTATSSAATSTKTLAQELIGKCVANSIAITREYKIEISAEAGRNCLLRADFSNDFGNEQKMEVLKSMAKDLLKNIVQAILEKSESKDYRKRWVRLPQQDRSQCTYIYCDRGACEGWRDCPNIQSS